MNSRPLQRVFDRLGLRAPKRLGEGGEGTVFDGPDSHVLKVYKRTTRAYLESLAEFQARVAACRLPYATPQILDIGDVEGVYYTLERRLVGTTLTRAFAALNEAQQRRLLTHYLDALRPLHAIRFPALPFGQVLRCAEAVTADSWPEFLAKRLAQCLIPVMDRVRQDVPDFEARLARFQERMMVEASAEEKGLVHGDYFPENVLVGENLEISALMDFSPHSVVGDFRMDVAGAVAFLELLDVFSAEHRDYLHRLARSHYGEEIASSIALYRVYYSLYYADSYAFDGTLYAWCLSNLTPPLF